MITQEKFDQYMRDAEVRSQKLDDDIVKLKQVIAEQRELGKRLDKMMERYEC
jgi:phage shock protein A